MKLTSQNQFTLRPPGETKRTTTRRGTGIARVIALSGVVGLFACQDATAPEATDQVNLAGPSLSVAQDTPLGMMGLWLLDATSWVLPSIDDPDKRSEMEATLTELASQLVTGAWDGARVNVTKAQAIRESLDTIDATEIGPIEVSLDQADGELTAIGK